MKKILALGTVLLFAVTLNAAVPVTITVDENGNGDWNGIPLTSPGALATDTGPGGLANALTYYFAISVPPPLGMTIGTVTPGDLLISEPPFGAVLSDLIRFRTGDPNFFVPASLVFYSDNSEGADSLADIGFPTARNANTYSVVEPGVEGGPQSFYYLPLLGQPGYLDDPGNPGHSYVAYNFLSEVPEPTAAVLLGAFLAGAFGLKNIRSLERGAARR